MENYLVGWTERQRLDLRFMVAIPSQRVAFAFF